MDALRTPYCLHKHINTCMLHTDNISVLIYSIHFLLYQVLLPLVFIRFNLKVQQYDVSAYV
jgi:hypothetical protein